MADDDHELPEVVRLLTLLAEIADELRPDPKYTHIVKRIEDWDDGTSPPRSEH